MGNKIWLLAIGAVCVSAAHAQTMYTVRENDNMLMTIDANTGSTAAVGLLGVGYEFGDIAYDANNGVMYAVGGWGNGFNTVSDLFRVDLNTGAATLVGSTGVRDVFGLAWDPQTGNLYAGQSTTSSGFFRLDANTGAATSIGNPGISLDGLTYDGSTGNILGMFAGPGSFHYIDRNTGSQSVANGGAGFVNNAGIAYLASNNSVYSIDWSGQFFRYDLNNNYAQTTVALLGGSYDGLAVVPEPGTMIALGAGLAALARRRRK